MTPIRIKVFNNLITGIHTLNDTFIITYIDTKFIYHIGCEWETLIKNASLVWPDNVRPLLSTIVPDT